MKIKKGDQVIVIAGKDKGKKGEVITAFPKKNRVIVQGVNMVTKHQKPNAKNNTGGIIKKESPIHVSNVMYYDKNAGAGTRIKKKILEDGTKVRVSVKSNETLD